MKTLVLLKDVPSSVEVIIFSDNIGKGLHTIEYQDFCEEYPFRKITFQKSGGEFHDRYIIIDWNTEHQRIYHCGASSKDAGQRITSITEVVDQMIYTDLINKLLKNLVLQLKQVTNEMLTQIDKFNSRFSDSGWCAYDSMSMDLIKNVMLNLKRMD